MLQISFSLPRILTRWTSNTTADIPTDTSDDYSGTRIPLPPAQTYDLEGSTEKRTRAVKHLLKLNHANHAVLYGQSQSQSGRAKRPPLWRGNEIPGLLTASYLNGATAEDLNQLYETQAEALGLEPWVDSPGEISTDDWRDFLGCSEYQRAYVNFFEDELVRLGYEWTEVVREYLFSGREPVFNSIFANFGQPLLHLACAFEFSSRELAMEALGLATTCYSDVHKYLDDPVYVQREASYHSTSLLDILQRVRTDERFDGIDHADMLFHNHEAALLDHWKAWQIDKDDYSAQDHDQGQDTQPVARFHSMQEIATALLLTQPNSNSYTHHILTTTHAVRTILPQIPTRFQIPLLRQWWLLTLTLYITGNRPLVDVKRIRAAAAVELDGRDWRWVVDRIVRGPYAGDARVVQTVRVLREAEALWGAEEGLWLEAGVEFVSAQ